MRIQLYTVLPSARRTGNRPNSLLASIHYPNIPILKGQKKDEPESRRKMAAGTILSLSAAEELSYVFHDNTQLAATLSEDVEYASWKLTRDEELIYRLLDSGSADGGLSVEARKEVGQWYCRCTTFSFNAPDLETSCTGLLSCD